MQIAGNKDLKGAMAEGPRGGVAVRDILSVQSPAFNNKMVSQVSGSVGRGHCQQRGREQSWLQR